MPRALAASLAVLLAAAGLAAPVASPGQGEQIDLPDGFQPEGIAIAGDRFYAGSIATGAVFRGSLASGAGRVVVPARAGRSAIGLDVDRGYVFVAGGSTGMAFVYDAATGADVAQLELASGDTFVNDVVVTRRAAWFTDSRNPVLYRVPLGGDGRPGAQGAVRTVPLTGAIRYAAGFNANGIDATADGKRLLIVQSNTGRLFTVRPGTGRSSEIALARGESVPNGDGILLRGRTLYVVQNRQNAIAVVRLAPGLGAGTVRRRITDAGFDVPTTVDAHGSFLCAVNARFGTTAASDTPYWITRVRG
jgi:sugar lactone lactonase YvrE